MKNYVLFDAWIAETEGRHTNQTLSKYFFQGCLIKYVNSCIFLLESSTWAATQETSHWNRQTQTIETLFFVAVQTFLSVFSSSFEQHFLILWGCRHLWLLNMWDMNLQKIWWSCGKYFRPLTSCYSLLLRWSTVTHLTWSSDLILTFTQILLNFAL